MTEILPTSQPKNWIETIAREADIGVEQLPAKEQIYMRQMVAKNIKI
jgi:hypothetical protein